MRDIEDMRHGDLYDFQLWKFPKIAGGGKALTGLFSDSNNILLWQESEDINRKKLINFKILSDSNFTFPS